MEALANGCVFIQPKFKEPHNRLNTVSVDYYHTDLAQRIEYIQGTLYPVQFLFCQEFLHGKPTARGYRSQMPYLQDFVGEPYVSIVQYLYDGIVHGCVCLSKRVWNFVIEWHAGIHSG